MLTQKSVKKSDLRSNYSKFYLFNFTSLMAKKATAPAASQFTVPLIKEGQKVK